MHLSSVRRPGTVAALVALLLGVAAALVWRSKRPSPAPDQAAAAPATTDASATSTTLTADELADEIGEESFPASDPPATY